jgi:hypothetical protein
MQTLQAWFQSVDMDRSNKISAAELGKMTFPGQPGSSALAGKPIGKKMLFFFFFFVTKISPFFQ